MNEQRFVNAYKEALLGCITHLATAINLLQKRCNLNANCCMLLAESSYSVATKIIPEEERSETMINVSKRLYHYGQVGVTVDDIFELERLIDLVTLMKGRPQFQMPIGTEC